MNIDKKKLTVQILALIGLALSIKLACIYYVANYEKYALSSFCSISEFVDCDGAARSTVSQFWGIPLAYWGIFFYITILFLTIVDKLKGIRFLKFLEVFKNPMSYIAVLGTIAFTVSMVLAGLSIFKIHKLCILCVITYFIDLIIALVAFSRNSIIDTFRDFIDGAKKYTKTFIVLVILAASFLCYSGITYNFVPHIKKSKSIMKYRKMTYNPYRVNGNQLGPENADVVIELYSDFVCPLCYIHNIMLHQAVSEFSNVKVVHHNFPFDKECNPYISVNMHPGACFMSKAAIAARNQGNYWGMSSMLYENQPYNEADVWKIASELGLNAEKLQQDMNSPKTMDEIETELKKAQDLGLDATPTMFVNGEKIVGVKPYYELKEILLSMEQKNNKILIHACCGICSGYPISLLKEMGYEPVVYFCNPNLDTKEEFERRLEAQKIVCMYHWVDLIIEEYRHEDFLRVANGLENEPERGRRCDECIRLRLKKTAEKARELGITKFTTSLVISPHKNFAKITRIAEELAGDLEYIAIDFKKKDGFLKTNTLSKKLGIYRQNYCGCEFSKGHLDKEEIKDGV